MPEKWIRFANCIACAVDAVEKDDFVELTMFLPAFFAGRFGVDEDKPVVRTYEKKMFVPDNESDIWEALCTFDGKKSFDATSANGLLRQQIDKLQVMNKSLQSSNNWLETQMKKAMTRPEELLKMSKGIIGAEPSRVIGSPYGYPPFYNTLGSSMPMMRRPFDEIESGGSNE